VLAVAAGILVAVCCHWYEKVGAGVPVHVPFVVVKVCPATAVPETTGATVFAGATATAAVEFEFADEDPAEFVPVTTHRIVSPAYVAEIT
jgi:hypothetical protein